MAFQIPTPDSTAPARALRSDKHSSSVQTTAIRGRYRTTLSWTVTMARDTVPARYFSCRNDRGLCRQTAALFKAMSPVHRKGVTGRCARASVFLSWEVGLLEGHSLTLKAFLNGPFRSPFLRGKGASTGCMCGHTRDTQTHRDRATGQADNDHPRLLM